MTSAAVATKLCAALGKANVLMDVRLVLFACTFLP